MRKQSEEKPETLQQAEGGVTEFNYNVEFDGNVYDYDSVDVVGEVVRVNVKYAMMLEHYSADGINDMENKKRYSEKEEDRRAYQQYCDIKADCDSIITKELGPDFK